MLEAALNIVAGWSPHSHTAVSSVTTFWKVRKDVPGSLVIRSWVLSHIAFEIKNI